MYSRVFTYILNKLEVNSAVGKAWLAQGITMEMMFRFIRTMRPGDLAAWAMRHMSKKLVSVYDKPPWTIEAVVKAAYPGFPNANSYGDMGNYHLYLPRTDTALPSGSYTGVAGLAETLKDSLTARAREHQERFEKVKRSPQYVPPAKGSLAATRKKDHERKTYQFNA
ncbi:hypothetical protein LTR17_004335 [Elasticomyces elasticus]|nr:hypothetical protein LTR17_004335 [Elasticomyces elasticus]